MNSGKFLPIAIAAVSMWVGCVAPSDEDVGAARSALALATFDDAWAELGTLHADAVERQLASLATDDRRDVERLFAERSDDPHLLRVRFTAAGTPRSIVVAGFQIRASDLGLAATASPRELADALVTRFAAVWRVTPETFTTARVVLDEHRSTAGHDAVAVEYRQIYSGLRVIGGVLRVIVDPAAHAVTAVDGSVLPIGLLSTAPTVSGTDAAARVSVAATEGTGAPRLVIWSNYRSGADASAHLAWQIPVDSSDGGRLREVYVDAADGRMLGGHEAAMYSLKRSLWDLHAQAGYGSNTCQRWQTGPPCSSYPSELAGCPAQCTACLTNVRDCALCTCRQTGTCGTADPTNCESTIYRYDETTGCVGNNDPPSEGTLPCDSEAGALWADMQTAYNYWQSSFARDSWDNLGTWMWGKVNVNTTLYGGLAQARYVDDDSTYDLVSVSIRDGQVQPQRDGHELGHALQLGAETYTTSLSFHAQGVDVGEGNADVQGYRYRGLTLGAPECPTPPCLPNGYRCDGPDPVVGSPYHLDHYTDFRSANAGQSNKFIADCHDWLLSNDTGSPITQYGVTVSPVSQATFDQIWFRTLDLYFATDEDLFDWWNDTIQSAYDLCPGYCSSYFSARDARDALGGWTGATTLPVGTTGLRPSDRIASATIPGGSRGPCIFYRYSGSTTAIYWSCYTPTGWTSAQLFNDTAVDPAGSEPAAAFRYEPPGKYYIYVAWRGTDSLVHYRRFDVDTFTRGPASVFDAFHRTNSAVAVASVWETAAIDRLLVVYHPQANPTYFYSTFLGGGSFYQDLLGPMDSQYDPALAAYPYPEGIYFVRPNSVGGTAPNHLRYRSYTMAGGGTWNVPAADDLTALHNTDSFMPTDAVRTDRGVALAEYNRSLITNYPHSRLRMTFTTMGDGTDGVRELWYATLRESETTPGTLERRGYRAVPLMTVTSNTSQGAGGLAPGVNGQQLFHFWGHTGVAGTPKISDWLVYGD